MNPSSNPVLLPRIKQMHTTSRSAPHGSVHASDGTLLGRADTVPLSIPLWADLALWVVVDVETHFEPIMDTFQADNPQVSNAHLIELVVRNMIEQVEIKVQGDPGTLVMAVCGGNFEAAQIINPAFWDAIHAIFPGDVVVGLPTPDMCMVADTNNEGAVSKLTSVANQVYTNPQQTARTSNGLYRKSPGDDALYLIGRHSEEAANPAQPAPPAQSSQASSIDTTSVPVLFAAINERRQAEMKKYFVEDGGVAIGGSVPTGDFIIGLAMAILKAPGGIVVTPGKVSEFENYCTDLVDCVVGRPDEAWDENSDYVHFTWSETRGSVSDGLRAFDSWLQTEHAMSAYRLIEVGVEGLWLSILATTGNVDDVIGHLAELGIMAQLQSQSTRR